MSKKLKYVAATPDRKLFYKVEEWESDFSGYGGSTSTEYTYTKTKNLENATVFDKDPTNIMKRYRNNDPFIILKVQEIIKRIIV